MEYTGNIYKRHGKDAPPIPLGGTHSQIKLVLILEKKGGRANSWQRTVRQGPQYPECSMVVFALKGRTASQVFKYGHTRHIEFQFVWRRSKKSKQAICFFLQILYTEVVVFFHSCNFFSLKKKKVKHVKPKRTFFNIHQFFWSPSRLLTFPTYIMCQDKYTREGRLIARQGDSFREISDQTHTFKKRQSHKFSRSVAEASESFIRERRMSEIQQEKNFHPSDLCATHEIQFSTTYSCQWLGHPL